MEQDGTRNWRTEYISQYIIMVVADSKDECILGTDFLTPHKCVVELKDNVLSIKGEQVPLQIPRQAAIPTCGRVVLENDVDLPPLSVPRHSKRIK